MKETTIDQTLVLCDLDSLLLDAAGNLPQLQRDVLQLFASRGGRLTVFSQRSPRAVRSLLGGVRLSAPALVCGGTLAYNFSEGSGTALCSFEGMEESVLKKLPSLSGVGIALQMRDGSTRAVRMSEGLAFHLKQEWTPFVLSNAADVKGEDVLRILFYQDKKQMPILPTLQKALGDAAAFLHAERLAPDTLVLTPGLVSGSAMLNAVCPPSGYAAEQLTVLAGCTQMLDLVHLAGESVVPADAAPELRLAANRMTLTDHDTGAAAELLYGMVRRAETLRRGLSFSEKVGYNGMKKASLTKTEQRFLWTAALVCAVCVALAFGFAVPRQTGPGRAAGSETPLIQLARVDLNTAGQDALCTLPGVGEQRARAIIEYREQYGRFAAVEEAAAVPGLTEAVVAEWDGLAYVS